MDFDLDADWSSSRRGAKERTIDGPRLHELQPTAESSPRQMAQLPRPDNDCGARQSTALTGWIFHEPLMIDGDFSRGP